LFVGGILLIFGLQWLRKAILRASGFKALRNERPPSTRANAPHELPLATGPVGMARREVRNVHRTQSG
jgi:hypothetical protein